MTGRRTVGSLSKLIGITGVLAGVYGAFCTVSGIFTLDMASVGRGAVFFGGGCAAAWWAVRSTSS